MNRSAASWLVLPVLLLAGCVDGARRASAPKLPSPPRGALAVSPPHGALAVLPKPVWQARKVLTDAVAVPGGRLHTVKSGETGIAIARAYGVNWSIVAAANGLKPPYTLEVGDRLLLPSARQAAAQLAALSVEDRAKAFDLKIDDIITGGEPAARPVPAKLAGKPPAKPGARQPGIVSSAVQPLPQPLPQLTGDAPQFRWPVDGRILSGFGAKPGGRFNDGVNLKASAGAPVRAAGDGVIAYAGDAIPGFGNLVLIKHAGGWVTAYAHNEALLVARGKRVAQGDIIARAGETGSVTEPQVHFELRRGRTPVDPTKLIAAR